jgi:hypothetical protein
VAGSDEFVVRGCCGSPAERRISTPVDCSCLRMKTDGNERKIPLSFPFSYFLTETGAGAGQPEAEMVAE